MTNTTHIGDGKASTVRTTFSRETTISIDIKSDPAIIWALLTNAGDYPRWNPTVVSIDGTIARGETIKLKASLDPKRTFLLTIKEFEPTNRLVWGDAQGSRIYAITKRIDGMANFSMTEKIGGLMFPLYARYIPPFDKSFEQFAWSLKKEAERIQHTKI